MEKKVFCKSSFTLFSDHCLILCAPSTHSVSSFFVFSMNGWWTQRFERESYDWGMRKTDGEKERERMSGKRREKTHAIHNEHKKV